MKGATGWNTCRNICLHSVSIPSLLGTADTRTRVLEMIREFMDFHSIEKRILTQKQFPKTEREYFVLAKLKLLYYIYRIIDISLNQSIQRRHSENNSSGIN